METLDVLRLARLDPVEVGVGIVGIVDVGVPGEGPAQLGARLMTSAF
jgi:hypothetical protein